MQQFMRKFVLSIALTIGFAMSVPSSAKAQVMGPGGITVLRPSVPATATLDPRQALPARPMMRRPTRRPTWSPAMREAWTRWPTPHQTSR
ncbi:MAG: hypothetical protein HYR84_10710, partial [Planctomycetes bacterium]|nr:hypothetical protein [Planctomycetota bacterium]